MYGKKIAISNFKYGSAFSQSLKYFSKTFFEIHLDPFTRQVEKALTFPNLL